MAGNPYAPPKAEVDDVVGDLPSRPSALARFVHGTLWALVVYLALVLPRAHGGVVYLVIGAVALSLLAGLIALCIPVRSKWLFVLPSMLGSLTIAYLIGSSA